ncbi:Hypothetical protein FKW44_007656, partial [Caligus rogercresseyi]
EEEMRRKVRVERNPHQRLRNLSQCKYSYGKKLTKIKQNGEVITDPETILQLFHCTYQK